MACLPVLEWEELARQHNLLYEYYMLTKDIIGEMMQNDQEWQELKRRATKNGD